jgi:protein-S-isoprenylcysteine O-methyltransferase Ste14
MVTLFALRVGREERMMRAEFGKEYEAYAARTRRIVPGVW